MITLKSIFWSKRSFLSGEHRRELLGFFLAEFLVFLIFLTVFLLHLFLHLHEIIEFTSLKHSDGFLAFLKHGFFLFWTGFLELFHGFLHVFHVIILREHNEFLLTTITSFLTGFFLVLIFREKSEFLIFTFLSSFLTVFLLHLFLHLHKIIEFTSLEHSDSFL